MIFLPIMECGEVSHHKAWRLTGFIVSNKHVKLRYYKGLVYLNMELLMRVGHGRVQPHHSRVLLTGTELNLGWACSRNLC